MAETRAHSPSVYIIFLNWNNSEETLECLESLKRLTYGNFKVVIIDNNSTDDSLLYLKNFKKEQTIYDIDIIENERNAGFAEGNNIGMRYALEQGADYVLFLNNDMKVDPMFLSEMMDVAQNNEKAGIIGSTIFFYDKKNLIWFGGDTPMKWTKMDEMIASTCDFYKKKLPPAVPPIQVSFITGACMLIRREALEKTGGFDKRFFLYFEDADLCFQIQDAGYELWWQPKAKLWHKVSATTLPKLGSPRLHYYHVRNVLLLGFKNGPWWLYLYHPLWAVYTAVKQMIKIIIGRQRDISKARLRGVIDYYRERFGKYEDIYKK
ncbi:MAG: glycosyltransferase family 2 protein [Candidatus Spechtbacterales bacterium]|nr:glycosyltransferase family 2 protein [Candidatus Spechtbacterales bacterium]